MKLTESHLRQMIRQELKKAMGLNENFDDKGPSQSIDVEKFIQVLTAAGDTQHAEDLKRYAKQRMFVNPLDGSKPEMVLYFKNGANLSPYNAFPTKLIKQALVRS